jgi:MFS family permease
MNHDTSASAHHSDWGSYSIYALGFLSLIATFNYLDRSILGLALPAIKQEMRLSDTVLGLVYGATFATFYAIFGIPVAWLADRGNRRTIIAVGFAFWSVMTALTGLVSNVLQLAASRFLMGAGEACCVPPAHSMISDLFPKASRPLALAIFGTSFSIAYVVFFPFAGWIIRDYGWRAMFIAAGAPGLVLAFIFLLSVNEPVRGASEPLKRTSEKESLPASVRFLVGSRTYLLIILGSTFMGANIYASSAWFPTFLSRVHALSLFQIASSIGPIRGVLGAVGIVAGGLLTNRLGRRHEMWRLRVPAIACLLLGPSEALFLLTDRSALWITGLALTSLLTLLHQAPVFAAAMSVAKMRMRALASSIIIFAAGLVGQAVGPLLIGALNDRLNRQFGDIAIRYSLLIVALGSVIAGGAFWIAARHLESGMRRVQTPDAQPSTLSLSS